MAGESTSLLSDFPLRGRRIRSGDLAGCERGSTLIEMAVTLPLLFTLLFCFMAMCLAFYSHDMISEAAREGTRYAMLHGASCPTSASPTCEATATQVNSYVTGLGWPNLGGGTMTVATTYPNGNEAVGSLVQVKITYVFAIRMAFVPANSLTMTSTSEAYIVQ
jgi:Flp pilus assembly protein TadG